jgi:TRAP-type uncharacterized transport system substrate-binding protein
MRLSVVIFFVSLMLGASALPLGAAQFGTREEAAAMVRRVQEKFKKDGPEATFRAINSKGPGLADRDLYPFVTELDTGLCVANGVTPAVTGKILLDLKDQDGRFIIQEFIKIATSPSGRGWIDYRWLNPVTKTIEDKTALIERMGKYFVGVGVYRNEQPNENTIGLISGSPNSDDTYLQTAYDLAEVLNDGDSLRIVPIVGIGGPKNIRDVRFLRGVDIGLTQTNILNNVRESDERMGRFDDKIVYIAKLFNEEVHLIARSNITSLTQLQGRKVNIDVRGSGTSYSMRDIFKALGIEVEEVSMSQAEALEKLKTGEIAATALIAGKPVRSVSKLELKDGLHFVPIPYPRELVKNYLPTTLTHDDYPDLIPGGKAVDTIAIGTVLIAYNWPKTNADRYRRVEKFVDAFFSKVAEFQKPPRHVKWREVNIAATLPGWTRFPAAQAWLDNQRREALAADPGVARRAVASNGATIRPAGAIEQSLPQRVDDPALFQEFLKWRQMQGR